MVGAYYHEKPETFQPTHDSYYDNAKYLFVQPSMFSIISCHKPYSGHYTSINTNIQQC